MKKILLALALVAGTFAFSSPASAQDVSVRIGGGGFGIQIGGHHGRNHGWNNGCRPGYGWNNGCNDRWNRPAYHAPIQVYVVVGYRWDRYYGRTPVYGYVWANWDNYRGGYWYRDPVTGGYYRAR